METSNDKYVPYVKLHDSLERMKKRGNYDVDKYFQSLLHEVGELEYFYCDLVKDGNGDDYYYPIFKRPRKHTLVYCNIGRGFPKELHDGHFCYILKDMGYKAIVIPCTSIKNNSHPANSKFELDIEVIKDHKRTKSRMQLSDIRCIDLQRIDTRKEVLEVVTDEKIIRQFVYKNIFL